MGEFTKIHWSFERESTLNRKMLKQLLNFLPFKCIIWTVVINQASWAFIFLFCYWNQVLVRHTFGIFSFVCKYTEFGVFEHSKKNKWLLGSESPDYALSKFLSPTSLAICWFQSHSYLFPRSSTNLESFLQISSMCLHLKVGNISWNAHTKVDLSCSRGYPSRVPIISKPNLKIEGWSQSHQASRMSHTQP